MEQATRGERETEREGEGRVSQSLILPPRSKRHVVVMEAD